MATQKYHPQGREGKARRGPEDWWSEDWTVRWECKTQITDSLGVNPELDLFALQYNKRCHRFYGPDSDEITDAMKTSWHGQMVWANPPFSMMGKVVSKMISDNAHGILIVPAWETTDWYPKALKIVVRRMIFPAGKQLFKLRGKSVEPLRWDVNAARVCLVAKRN